MKPKITEAMVDAASAVVDGPLPDNYFKVSSDEQRKMRRSAIRGMLIAALTAKALEGEHE